MGAVAVVALAVVFEHQLPVALLDQVGLEGDLAVFQGVRGDEGADRRAEAAEVRRLLRHAHVDVGVNDLHMHRFEVVLRLVEIRTHVAGIDQVAIQLECPLVVRAHQLGDFTRSVFAHLGTAVATGIVERAHFAVLATHDSHRVVANLQGEILAGLGNLECMAGEDPVLVPDMLKVLAINFRVQIQFPGQYMPRLALFDQANDGFIAIHYYPPATRCSRQPLTITEPLFL
ncbi:hypothetical protein D3C81_685200 [compost metagenome]